MASQSFNARGGISVGLTGTSVISETGFGTFPVGITTEAIWAIGITLSSGGPAEGEVLTATDTSGTATWRLPSTPMHYSGSANAYYLQPWNSTAPANTATTADNTKVYYYPFWLQSTVQVRPSVMSSTTTPGVTGTVYIKVFNASRSTGAPSGSSIGTFNNITITSGGNTNFVSPAPGITLSAGWYWLGVNFERNATNMRRNTFTTTHPFYANTFGINTPSVGYVFYNFEETVAAGSGVPSSVGTLTENTSLAATPAPTIMFRVV
jgi:hypothetical protein